MDETTVANNFQDLPVWQKAHRFVLSIYNYSDYFPQKEACGLTSQLRLAAIAIPVNIAEGFRQKSEIDERRWLEMADCSLEQCRYYLILAKELGYGDHPELMPQLEEISRMLKQYDPQS
jgi:four helix bundle protein